MQNEVQSLALHKISTIITKGKISDDLVDQLFKNISIYLNINEEINFDNILSVVSNINHRNFIAIALLRTCKSSEEILDYDRVTIIKLFDEAFEKTLYSYCHLKDKEQTHIKISKLIGQIDNIEEKITKELKIVSLDKFKNFKQKFFNNFHGKYKKIVTPFLDSNIYENIDSIFQKIEDHITSSTDYNSFIKIKSLLEDQINKLEEVNSDYNNRFLLKPFQDILLLIKEDFDSCPIAKPSQVLINESIKKYPFSIQNLEFKLFVQLQNIKDGKAYKTEISIIRQSENIGITETHHNVGTINGNSKINISFNAKVLDKSEKAFIEFKVRWFDFKHTKHIETKTILYVGQRTDIDWDYLENNELYSREAIEEEEELIGRTNILKDLNNGLSKKKSINSYYVHGQKRVGKTSIVKVLKSKIENAIDKENYTILYIEGGDYVDTNFEDTINNLGKKICKRIQMSCPETRHLEIPNFNNSLQPLVDFLDDVTFILKNKKIIIILDEFDEISSDLYKRSDIGNAFFLTIRSISNKAKYSFILVGGEKIDFIISIQGEQLNKFKSIRVDYFKKEDWNQFKDLVQVPLKEFIEVSDDAINLIFSETEGNPFFTNVICEEILQQAIENRDSHITAIEMDNAIKQSLKKAEIQIFSHFWEDGIREDNDKEEEVSYKRRRILLSIAELLKNGKGLNKENIIDYLISDFPENELERVLKEFVDRKILIQIGNNYEFRIRFFKKWLSMYGSENIITTLSEEQKIRIREKKEKNAEIKSSEILNLLAKKNLFYNGEKISTDKIRMWIEQFGSNTKQRLMFRILENINFFNESIIRTKMKDIYYELNFTKKASGGGSVNNVLVSYLDEIGKSGPQYAKIFTDVNTINSKNICEKDKILERFKNNQNLNILVFLDDFIGTGESILLNIKQLVEKYPELVDNNIKIFIGAICGFQHAKEHILKELKKLKLYDIDIILAELLSNGDKCFSESVNIFDSIDDKNSAEAICKDFGYNLEKKNPLGFGNCQSLVVFPDTCPNNSLPILWKKNPAFTPLFERVLN